jgi:DeoR/GlpR family transcriptional regulator of sugar metabolism
MLINADIKMAIANAAVNYVNAGDHVFLDASSTCYFFGRAIMKKNIEGVTIVTNSLHLLSEYRENESAVKLVSTGGSVDRELCAFLGNFTTDFISRIHVAKTFVSAAGWSVRDGISTTSDFILGALKAAISAAPKRYCLVDSAKFGREYIFKVANLDVFDAIITDGGIGKQVAQTIRKAGLPLVISG